MKTFNQFISEGIEDRLGKMSDSQYNQFLKGRNPAERKSFDAARLRFKTGKTNPSQKTKQDFVNTNKTANTTPGSQRPPAEPARPQSNPAGNTPPNTKTGRGPFSWEGKTRGSKWNNVPGYKGHVRVDVPQNVRAAAGKVKTGLGKLAGPALSVGSGYLDYKERRDAGQSQTKAVGGAVANTVGTEVGWKVGARLGSMAPVPLAWKPVTTGVGALGGSLVGGAAMSAGYDKVADATRPARQAVSKATGYDKFQQKNALIKPGSGMSGIGRAQQTVDTRSARQVAAKAGTYGARQGSALTGIGGPAVVNRQAGTLTSKGKTATLAKTQLIRDPKTGKNVVGDLAYKGGKATYLARPSVSSRDTSISANVGRALNIGRFSKSAEQQAAKTEYRTALANTQQYQRQLGITPKSAAKQKLPGR